MHCPHQPHPSKHRPGQWRLQTQSIVSHEAMCLVVIIEKCDYGEPSAARRMAALAARNAASNMHFASVKGSQQNLGHKQDL